MAEHTAIVMASLGFAPEEVQALHDAGVVQLPGYPAGAMGRGAGGPGVALRSM